MKCVILGGGGFLGSHLCEALLARGHAVRLFDRPNLVRFRRFAAAEPVEWMEGDFNDRETLARAVGEMECVFHLVSTTLPKSSNDNPVYDVETNLVGTLHLLELARNHAVRKVVFVSSGGTVYGIPRQIPIEETHATDPICSYGIAKLAIEKYLHLYHQLYGLDYTVLRLANPFGERQRPGGNQGAVAVFLGRALQGLPIEIWGDGSVVRDYIYVGDAVEAMVRAMENDCGLRTFNIGSGEGKSLLELAEAIRSVCALPVKIIRQEARSLDVPANVLSIARAGRHLDWQPRIGFADGLQKTFSWLRDQQH